MAEQYRIAVDFDGTLVEHEYPDLGPVIPECFKWLKRFKEANACLMLWTMRSSHPAYGRGADALAQAVELCRENGIEWDYVNADPAQLVWTTSPKLNAHRFIDDRGFGCPLVNGHADWSIIGPAVYQEILTYNDRQRRLAGIK